MENNTRNDILVDGTASLVGFVLALYSLINLKDPGLLRVATTVVGVGVFLLGSIRYGLRFRQLKREQKNYHT